MKGRLRSCFAAMVILLTAVACPSKGSTAVVPVDGSSGGIGAGWCLSWRLAVETGNLRAWPTVPLQCMAHVEGYMLGGQHRRDVRMVVRLALAYLDGIYAAPDGMDTWVLDVDDTCLSNLAYYAGKRFGVDPYNRSQFGTWVQMRASIAIPEVLELFRKVLEKHFKVFLLTGRDEEVQKIATIENLHLQGFIGYEGLILRSPQHRGESAMLFKSEVRKQLVNEGYRIRGNVGDQWSDLSGDHCGDRIFKIPNPLYFVP